MSESVSEINDGMVILNVGMRKGVDCDLNIERNLAYRFNDL